MKFSNIFFYAVLILVLIFGCSPQLNYLGKSYPPTKNVDMFFDAKDITVSYKVIGVLNFKILPSIFDKNQNSAANLMVEKGKLVGANAILVTRYSSGIQEELTEDIRSKKVVSKNSEYILVEAKLLKYKN